MPTTTYSKHYLRLFAAIDKAPKKGFLSRWHYLRDTWHENNCYLVAISIQQGYVEAKGNYLRVTRKGRKIQRHGM